MAVPQRRRRHALATLTVVPFFSSLAAKDWVDSLIKRLEATGAQVTTAETLRQEAVKGKPSPFSVHTVIFVGTGGTEQAIARFLSDVRVRPPILLLSHDGNNSLPAAMETRTHLEQRGMKARIIHAPLERLMDQAREWCFYEKVEERIRSSRLGLIGSPSPWLMASKVSAPKVRRRWGLTIEKYPLTRLLNILDDRLSPGAKSSLDDLVARAKTTKVSEQELTRAASVAQALTQFAHTHKLDAVTVECFKLLQQTGITGCYALSQLNNSGDVVAACEGDVPAAFTMMVVRLLTGQPGFMANVSDVDFDSNSAVFAHCTVATRLLNEYTITTHFESGKSVAVQGRFEPQPVTVVKVFGSDLTHCWTSSGVVIPHETTESGCRTQVRAKLVEPVTYFLEQSLANHHVIVPGDCARRVREFFAFALGQ